MKTRRELIQCGACALFAVGCGVKVDTGEEQESPGVSDTTENLLEEEPVFDPCETIFQDGWEELSFDLIPELREVGAYATWNGVVIAHVENGCFAAVEARCTHQGGEIFYSATRKQFSCLLHAATFELSGEWTMGQVTSNLKSYPVVQEGDALFIGSHT